MFYGIASYALKKVKFHLNSNTSAMVIEKLEFEKIPFYREYTYKVSQVPIKY